MVLFRCPLEASWLKAFLKAYSSVEKFSFCWLFTKEHVEGKALDPSRTRAIVFRIFPLDYRSEERKVGEMWGVFPTWVEGNLETFRDALRRYKVRETVTLEVREDGSFWVGDVRIGNVIEEKDVPEGFILPTPKLTADATLKVVVKDFRRIIDSVPGIRVDMAKIGFSIKGLEENVIVVFENEEKFTRIDIKRYEPWLLEIGGIATACYRFDGFREATLLGLTEVAKITLMNKAPCQVSYSGDFFDVDMVLADYEAYEELGTILAMKPAYRRPLFVLREEEVNGLRGVVRSVDPLFRGEEVWFGMNPYDFWFYWSFYDKGYFKMSRAVFEDWLVDGSYAGSFNLSTLSSWIRDVETLECWLEDEAAKAMLLVGKGKKIATKEIRSETLELKLDVPEITPVPVFKGDRRILVDVFTDALTARDDFLVFMSTPYEIKVFGQDAIYYRASLPIDGFQTVEEDFIPVSERFLKNFADFFERVPVATVTLGRPFRTFDIYIGAESAVGELRALTVQTADEVERAVEAYKKEVAPPVAPPEAKPIPVPPKNEDVMEILRAAPNQMMTHEALVSALVEKNFDKSASLELIAEMIRTGELYIPREPYVKIAVPRVEVRILKEIPEIVGVDLQTYGPYKPGEMAYMPKENADVLVKQGVAEYPKPPPTLPPEEKIEELMKRTKEKFGITPQPSTHEQKLSAAQEFVRKIREAGWEGEAFIIGSVAARIDKPLSDVNLALCTSGTLTITMSYRFFELQKEFLEKTGVFVDIETICDPKPPRIEIPKPPLAPKIPEALESLRRDLKTKGDEYSDITKEFTILEDLFRGLEEKPDLEEAEHLQADFANFVPKLEPLKKNYDALRSRASELYGKADIETMKELDRIMRAEIDVNVRNLDFYGERVKYMVARLKEIKKEFVPPIPDLVKIAEDAIKELEAL